MKYFLVAVSIVTIALCPAIADCDSCPEVRLLITAGEYDKAASQLKKAIKADKKSAEAHGLRAVCLAHLEERKAAAKSLGEFLKLAPSTELLEEVRIVFESRMAESVEGAIEFVVPQEVDPPFAILASKANYPTVAAEVGLEGQVVLDAVLGVDGRAGRIEVRRLDNTPVDTIAGFEESAINCLRRWRFFPAMKDGQPIAVNMSALISFRIIR